MSSAAITSAVGAAGAASAAGDARSGESSAVAVGATPSRELRVDLLVGCKVYDAAGACIGRLEEICAEVDGADHVVREYHVGKLAAFERLFGGRLWRAVLRRLSGGRLWTGYAVDWREMDLGDPARPRVRRRESELKRLRA